MVTVVSLQLACKETVDGTQACTCVSSLALASSRITNLRFFCDLVVQYLYCGL